jgi:hypothetical protein
MCWTTTLDSWPFLAHHRRGATPNHRASLLQENSMVRGAGVVMRTLIWNLFSKENLREDF